MRPSTLSHFYLLPQCKLYADIPSAAGRTSTNRIAAYRDSRSPNKTRFDSDPLGPFRTNWSPDLSRRRRWAIHWRCRRSAAIANRCFAMKMATAVETLDSALASSYIPEVAGTLSAAFSVQFQSATAYVAVCRVHQNADSHHLQIHWMSLKSLKIMKIKICIQALAILGYGLDKMSKWIRVH